MLTTIKIDLSAFKKMAEEFAQAGTASPDVMRRAINHTGDKARTAMIRALVPQTGLKRKVIVKALKVSKISAKSGGSYTIKSRGGDIRLKFFGAKETTAGVTAKPWNEARLYAHTFIKGGRFPNRVALALGGNVFVRAGNSRTPIHSVKSGLFIPTEMVKGESEAAFYRTAQADLANSIAHELLRAL